MQKVIISDKLCSCFCFTVLALFLFFACGKDEEPAPPDNSFTYNGTKYEINDIILRYNGLADLTYHDGVSEDTHHVFDLFFTDGIIEFDCHGGCYSNATGTDATYFVAVRFATVAGNHTNEFPMQTFNAIHPDIFHAGNSPTDSDFYTTFFFRIDEGDLQFNPSDIFVDGSKGSITFARSGNEYVVTINAVDTDATNILPIEGGYIGTIEKVSL